ncbi:ParA family protein [Rhodobacteraceae bacterium CCMM004]|nr:ParA family protein [Rhodobacteraceae bacterium CCMM004]
MAGKVITVAQQKGGSGKTTIAVNLAVAFLREGLSVAVLDTDPQGSLGRWFMTRREGGDPGLDFSTASAWGVGYECDKLRKLHDMVIVDTPPKVDSDLRPALRESDLIVVPVATSQVDLWATESVLDLAERTRRPAVVVLNRYKAGTRVADDVGAALEEAGMPRLTAVLGNRIAYAETLGQGRGVQERGRGAWSDEVEALAREVRARLEA